MTLRNGKYKLGSQRWTIVATVEEGKLASIDCFKDETEFRSHQGIKIANPWMWSLVGQALAAGLTMEPYPT